MSGSSGPGKYPVNYGPDGKQEFFLRGTFGDESGSEDQPTREQNRIGDRYRAMRKAAEMKPKTREEKAVAERIREESAKRLKDKAEGSAGVEG